MIYVKRGGYCRQGSRLVLHGPRLKAEPLGKPVDMRSSKHWSLLRSGVCTASFIDKVLLQRGKNGRPELSSVFSDVVDLYSDTRFLSHQTLAVIRPWPVVTSL